MIADIGARDLLFRVDGSAHAGAGHVMRCLTLAAHAHRAGRQVHFACAETTRDLEQRILEGGYLLHRLPAPPPRPAPAAPGWEMQVWSDAAQRADAAATCAAVVGMSLAWVVVDHYRLDRTWERDAAAAASHLMVIDDLANRPHEAALLLDQGYGRLSADYAQRVPPTCRILAGVSFALLRPEFAAARAMALARRQQPRQVRRVLLSLGATDVDACTEAATHEVLHALPEAFVDVVLGNDAPSRPGLERLAAHTPRLHLHFGVRDLTPLMVRADVAVGAGGTTSWERCCLGLPTLTLVLAENQRAVTERLAASGATIQITDTAALGPALRELAADSERRRRLADCSARIADGRGAARVHDAMAGIAQ